MNVASLDLCKELYELSGWNDNELWDCEYRGHRVEALNRIAMGSDRGEYHWREPRYDLNYLLGKLPSKLYLPTYKTKRKSKYPSVLDLSPRHDWSDDFKLRGWSARYLKTRNLDGYIAVWADSPADAAAKLCIELWNQGILQKPTESAA